MDIRPDRTSGSLPLNQATDSSGNANGKAFETRRRPDSPEEGKVSGAERFQRIAAQFRKADLKNPARADQMIAQAADHLLANEFPELHASERTTIAEWMQTDPIFRRQFLKYFERVLS